MGIKIIIKQQQLPKIYQKYNLVESIDGISDTVYLLGNTYVLKIFENQTKEQIQNEKKLLDKLKHPNTPKVIEILKIQNKFALIYTQIDGKSIKNPNLIHIKQIGLFLKELHNSTKKLKSSNIKLFTNKRLSKLVEITNNPILIDNFNNLNLELKNDGIIHGDLFTDNAKFKKDKLMGVYDFGEACEGDFLFDLAVIALSWCFDKKFLNNDKLNILLDSYGSNIAKPNFIEYVKYALLFYAVTRYISGHNYNELIVKFNNIKLKRL
jgi:homoserine kinase type II